MYRIREARPAGAYQLPGRWDIWHFTWRILYPEARNVEAELKDAAPPYDSQTWGQETTDNDWGVWGWPSQLFALGKADSRLFVNSKRYITIKNTMNWNAVVFCECETIRYCSTRLELCISLIGLLQTKHLTNGEQWKGHAVIETDGFDMIYMFCQRPSSRGLRDSTDAAQVNCILLSTGQSLGQIYSLLPQM
jgi:hypothetical protein